MTKMKRIALALLALAMLNACIFPSLAEEYVAPADQPFSNAQVEQAHIAAQEKLKADYLYDPRLYTCILREATDGAFVFAFNWMYSETTIYTVSVPAGLGASGIEAAYNTAYSMDEYYHELNNAFCKNGGLFGDWSIEEKAWLCSIMDAHWALEKFRTYAINPAYMPFYSPIFQRLLEQERCGLPDEKSISEEDAYAIAMARAGGNEAIAALKPWKVVQTYYLVNDPERPVWRFRIGKNYAHTYDIVIDAHTGNIEEITEREL